MPFVTHGTPELYASAAWDAFRATPEARFIAMMEGKYLLRAPFEATKALRYEQPAELATWGHGSALLAIAMGLSFWRYRLAAHAFEAFDGWVDRLPALEGRTAKRVFGSIRTRIRSCAAAVIRQIARCEWSTALARSAVQLGARLCLAKQPGPRSSARLAVRRVVALPQWCMWRVGSFFSTLLKV